MGILAGPRNQAPAPESIRQRTAVNINRMDNWLAIHTEAHEKVLTVGCPYCTCRAINAIEGNSLRTDVATAFLDKVGTPAVLEDVRELRAALGNDAFAWMFKQEWMR